MTTAELAQALLALCSAVVAVGLALAILVPAEPIAPGQFGDHRAAVAQTLLPIWRPELDLDDEHLDDGPPLPAQLRDVDVDRLWAAITALERSRRTDPTEREA